MQCNFYVKLKIIINFEHFSLPTLFRLLLRSRVVVFNFVCIFLFRYFHPERPGGGYKSVTDRLRDHADFHRRISPSKKKI